ncbi:hypothetical protein SLA2020_475550 [Shorea laevis]
MWAIRDGLNIALNRGFFKLISETDCRVSAILLETGNSRFHSFGTLISDSGMLLAQFHEVEVHHLLREANAAADYLTKLGTHLDSPLVFDSCPSDLSNILYLDAIENTVPITVRDHHARNYCNLMI